MWKIFSIPYKIKHRSLFHTFEVHMTLKIDKVSIFITSLRKTRILYRMIGQTKINLPYLESEDTFQKL